MSTAMDAFAKLRASKVNQNMNKESVESLPVVEEMGKVSAEDMNGGVYQQSPNDQVMHDRDLEHNVHIPMQQSVIGEFSKHNENVSDNNSCQSIGATGLSILGLNPNVSLVKPALREDIVPLVLNNISDSTGDIFNRLYEIMVLTGVTVLPLKECGVFESITFIPSFELINVDGKMFASYTGDNYPTKYLDSLIDDIKNRLTNAQSFGVTYDSKTMSYVMSEECVLKRKVILNNKEVWVPSLCKSELSHIATYFANYNVNVIGVNGSYNNLIVGLPLDALCRN